MTLPFKARNEVPFIIVGFADRLVSNISRSQPLTFYRQKLCKINFANLKKSFSMICGFRIPDSGFGFRFPASDSGLRFPGFRVARYCLLGNTKQTVNKTFVSYMRDGR